MGFFSGIWDAAVEANEEAHGARLRRELDDTASKMSAMSAGQVAEICRRFDDKRNKLLQHMGNWTAEGRLKMAVTLRDAARKRLDFNVVESYALWMASAWLEAGERRSANAAYVREQLEQLLKLMVQAQSPGSAIPPGAVDETQAHFASWEDSSDDNLPSREIADDVASFRVAAVLDASHRLVCYSCRANPYAAQAADLRRALQHRGQHRIERMSLAGLGFAVGASIDEAVSRDELIGHLMSQLDRYGMAEIAEQTFQRLDFSKTWDPFVDFFNYAKGQMQDFIRRPTVGIDVGLTAKYLRIL